MSLPSTRTMPVVDARPDPRFGFRLVLPDGRERIAIDEAEVRRIVARELPGTAIRYVTAPSSAPNGAGMARTALQGASQSGQSGAPSETARVPRYSGGGAPHHLPQSGIGCSNYGATMLGSPCSVCGYRRRKPSRYPIGHDALTDSYRPAAGDKAPVRGTP